ncbi:hypothetical protein [Manganibacter manganicus]|uniref:hypothetical protein n=1 Tax=Manganibacter manganicus TaxID=1873176 RepID=UPI001118490C|nr:hypothetical protein [Pseudaminobacter manganicus]
MPILFVLTAATGLAVWSIRLHSPIEYYINLKGIQDGKYPSGAAFSPNDLLIPQVIGAVAKKFAIEDQAALRQAFQVRYGSVLEAGLNDKYRKRLANKSLTTTEIDAINARYAAELSKTVRSGLKIDFDYLSVGVDKASGKAMAAALPEAWTTIYPQLFKVIVDTRLQNVAIPKNLAKLDDASSLLFASHAMRNLRRGLTIISEDDRLNSVATIKGNTAADLMQGLDRFATQYFDPLFQTIDQEDPISGAYVRQTTLEISNQQRQLAGFNATINDLQNFRGLKQNLSDASSSGASFSTTGTSSVQLNESGINEIAGLVERATLADYLTEVLNKRQGKLVEIAELEKELAMLKNPLPANTSTAFREAATEQFKTIVDQYTELLGLAQQRFTGFINQMYAPASSPQVLGTLLPPRSLQILGLSALLGLIAAGIASMLRPEKIRKVAERAPPMVLAVNG